MRVMFCVLSLQDKESADDFLGGLMFDLHEVPQRKPPESPLPPQWYRLEAKNGKGRVRGMHVLLESFLLLGHNICVTRTARKQYVCFLKNPASVKLLLEKLNLMNACHHSNVPKVAEFFLPLGIFRRHFDCNLVGHTGR